MEITEKHCPVLKKCFNYTKEASGQAIFKTKSLRLGFETGKGRSKEKVKAR